MIDRVISRRGALSWIAGLIATVPVLSLPGCGWRRRGPDPDGWLDVYDAEAAARSTLTPGSFAPLFDGDMFAAGEGSPATVNVNQEREAFNRLTLRPRLLVDVSSLDLSTTLFGRTLVTPIMAGTTPIQRVVDDDAAREVVRGASKARAGCLVGYTPGLSLKRVVAGFHEPWIYYLGRADASTSMIDRAVEAGSAGCTAVCVDSVELAGLATTPNAALSRLREAARVPVLCRGLPSDAASAAALAALGADGIVVGTGGTLEAIDRLRLVKTVTGPTVPVLLASEIRRGTDVLVALALGARAVIMTRPVAWALVAGHSGVRKVLELVEAEFALSMALSGRPSIASISGDAVRLPTSRPASLYPLLESGIHENILRSPGVRPSH
jgi:4-hydroxymandelate oxidase